ncbi:MAG: LarC family nickel insertion protein [Deltaproteobacteria bacterium]|nr:LarC family nickel insertion protein [Deltaproteobacteria bacterium]
MPGRLFMDCSSGISGGMFLSALTDLGVDFAPLEEALRCAGIELSFKSEPVSGSHGAGMFTEIICPTEADGAGRGQSPPDAPGIIAHCALPEIVRRRALEMLARLEQAGLDAHGVRDAFSFHEGGAVHALAEVLGAVWGLHVLEVAEVWSNPLPWFSAGTAPDGDKTPALPRPVTLNLLRGKPFFYADAAQELITPGGALLLDTLVTRFLSTPSCANIPAMKNSAVLENSGRGYAPPELSKTKIRRCLRLHLFNFASDTAAPGYIMDEVGQISCHLDHLTGEEIGHALLALNEAGALDVLWLPGLTKKNRPGGELRVLCRPEDLPQMQEAVFIHTHTLGLRSSVLERLTLPRREEQADTRWGRLRAKEYTLNGQNFSRVEYEALARAASEKGRGLPALRLEK